MIHDNIKNIKRDALFPELIDFLETINMNSLQKGIHKISDGFFVLVNEYTTADNDGILENHHSYIDVQVMEKGEEHVAIAFNLEETAKANDNKEDYELVKAKATLNKLAEGEFMVFYPGEFHKPGITINKPNSIKKYVFKIKTN